MSWKIRDFGMPLGSHTIAQRTYGLNGEQYPRMAARLLLNDGRKDVYLEVRWCSHSSGPWEERTLPLELLDDLKLMVVEAQKWFETFGKYET